jgi:arylsulfatase A-like enzyme
MKLPLELRRHDGTRSCGCYRPSILRPAITRGWSGHRVTRPLRPRALTTVESRKMPRLCPPTIAFALASSLASGCLFAPSPRANVQNVIVLSVDALSVDALRPYNDGAEALPHFDRFARGAIVFQQAFTSASWTLPAHASLFTGLYPDRHGVVRPGKRLGDDQATLASLLREEGLETVAFTGGNFLSASFGLSRGFDRYDGWTATRPWRPQLRLHQGGSEDGELFDRAIAYLRDVGREKRRFFLFLHTYFVHDYYEVDGNYELARCVLGQKPCGSDVWEELRARYRQRLVGFDERFGRLLEALEETGLRDSTLLIVLSDHGEGFDPEGGRIHHGGRLHQDLIRIPLLIAGARLPPRVSGERVSIVDVAPTLGELLAPRSSGDYDGVSFASRLRGDAKSEELSHPRTLYAMEHAYRWVDGARVDFRAPEDGPPSFAVIHRNLYYIRRDDHEEIYDLRSDPEQRANLAGASFDPTPFRRALDARASFKGGAEAMQMDQELEDRLRSLGYIQ